MRISPSAPLQPVLRRTWAAVGVLGGLASVLIGIYSDQARTGLEWLWGHTALFVLVLVVVGTLATIAWQVGASTERKRSFRPPITAKSLDIRAADFDDDLPVDQAVYGRELHFLEREVKSDTVVVLLHGLGLDANDFRPYMYVAGVHTIAITLFGFNTTEAHDTRYRPIGLTTHAELVNGALNNIRRQYENKKLLLVGFSTGADMILRLGELWKADPTRRPRLAGLLLLDPNINHSSMVVSGGFATTDPSHPLAEFKRITQIPSNLEEFENITEYLHKICKKDAAHIQQHAKDWWDYWEPDGQYGKFFTRVEILRGACARTRLIFSVHYEEHFNELVALARQRNLHALFDLLKVDHFDLIDEDFLNREVAAFDNPDGTSFR
jgi:pimeloyl-ACP methyl ester carboxylesterase